MGMEDLAAKATLDIMQQKRADIDTKSCELKIDGKFSRISTGHSLETVKHTANIEVPSLERLIYKNAMAFYADEECHWVPQTACGR